MQTLSVPFEQAHSQPCSQHDAIVLLLLRLSHLNLVAICHLAPSRTDNEQGLHHAR